VHLESMAETLSFSGNKKVSWLLLCTGKEISIIPGGPQELLLLWFKKERVDK
jgi:hypothetical protein